MLRCDAACTSYLPLFVLLDLIFQHVPVSAFLLELLLSDVERPPVHFRQLIVTNTGRSTIKGRRGKLMRQSTLLVYTRAYSWVRDPDARATAVHIQSVSGERKKPTWFEATTPPPKNSMLHLAYTRYIPGIYIRYVHPTPHTWYIITHQLYLGYTVLHK